MIANKEPGNLGHIVKAHGNVYIVNDINEMQIVIANQRAGFHSSVSMKEQLTKLP